MMTGYARGVWAVIEWHNKTARQLEEIAKDEPRIEKKVRDRARDAARHHAASAAAITERMLSKGTL